MEEPIIYVDRRHTNCEKWDGLQERFGRADLLPLWVADMDFRVPQSVIDAEKEYLECGAFGYYSPPDSYYQAILDWEREEHGYAMQREWLRYAPGVVPAINWLIQILTAPGDGILVLTPVYYPFLHSVRNNGRRLVSCELCNDGGKYTVDFTRFEAAIAEEGVRLLILSSPHNPVGRVWQREELKAMLDICKRHGVRVLSDEIHQDFTFDGHQQIPSATVGDYDSLLITLSAASKTFNLASCKNCFVIIPDASMRKAFDEFVKTINIVDGNPFGYIALEAAYRGGKGWLKQVKEIIWGNYLYLKDSLLADYPALVISPLEGTYLMWVDFSAYLKPEEMEKFFQDSCRIAVDYGTWFEGNAPCHARFNLATSRENIEYAAAAIKTALKAHL